MIKELNIYWSSIEFSYENIPSTKKNLKGGFVYCFVKAFDVRDAIYKIECAFKSENLIIIKIDYVSVYDQNMAWETGAQTENFVRLHDIAQNSSDVVFDDFYSYEAD